MFSLALGIEYLGSRYCGWQYQPHCVAVQQVLQEALSEIADERIEVACAGRTDTGVHALGQVVSFSSLADRPSRAWLQGTNTKLPTDIRVAWVKEVAPSFHARFSAIARQYRYVIYNRAVNSVSVAGRATWQPHSLDEVKMNLASKPLIGEQDFSSFRASGCQAEHAMRNIQSIQVTRSGDFVFIDIQANAFLHHMVRNIVGSLIEVGLGNKPMDWISALLTLKDRTKAGMTAAADGLYFVNAIYPAELEIPKVTIDQRLWSLG